MKTLKTILLWMLSFAVSMAMAAGVAMWTDNDNAVVCMFFFAPIVMALLFGLFDVATRNAMRGGKHEGVRPQKRSYGHAAVFIGTACLFIGAPQQCDDLADGLWHHGQQAEVRELTGEEQAFDIL